MREERSSVKTLLEEPLSPQLWSVTHMGESNRMTVLGIDNSGLTLNSPL